MDDFDFDSTDVAETEEFLGRSYASMRIRGDRQTGRTRVTRRSLGPVSFDTIEVGYELAYKAEPLQRICLVRVHSGFIRPSGPNLDVLVPGDVAVLTPPELPYSGRVSASYDITMFDPGLLGRGGDNRLGNPDTQIRLGRQRPRSVQAGRRLAEVIEYLGTKLAGNDLARTSELLTSNAAALLAASTLQAFGSHPVERSNATRRDAGPRLLRRAVAFIDDNAQRDISIDDIAGAVYLSPRSVQYMFRKYMDCSPIDYLRRVRLEFAHRELLAADPSCATVASIATKWGFAHAGRFAGLYRRTHGHSPHVTLRSGA